MLTAGLVGLDLAQFERVVVVSLAEYFHPTTRISAAALQAELAATLGLPAELRLLEESTANSLETIEAGIECLSDDVPIVIKDSDNYIAMPGDWWSAATANFVGYGDLSRLPDVAAGNKSYVRLGRSNLVEDMVEKKVISSYFNVGLVGFATASSLIYARQQLELARESYVSDVVAQLMVRGVTFHGLPVADYDDWGTLQDWQRYCSSFSTLFCDLDGTLCENEHPLDSSRGWNSFVAIEANVAVVLDRVRSGRCQIVFTTSRAEKHRNFVSSALRQLGFEKFELIMGLQHAKRLVINDFADTAPHPTALAINLPRNSPTLGHYL